MSEESPFRKSVRTFAVVGVILISLAALLPNTASLDSNDRNLAKNCLGMAAILLGLGVAHRGHIGTWATGALTLLFLVYAGINTASIQAGKSECGCFPVRVDPRITLLIDLALAGALGYELFQRLRTHAAPHTYAALGCGIAALAGGYVAAHAQLLPLTAEKGTMGIATSDNSLSVGELAYIPRRPGENCLVLLYRADCEKCRQLLPEIRIEMESSSNNSIVFEMDVASGEARQALMDFGRNDITFLKSFTESCAKYHVPSIVTLLDGRIVGILKK